MNNVSSSEELRKVAMLFGQALESKNCDSILERLSNDSEIDIMDIHIEHGRDSARRCFEELFVAMAGRKLLPNTIRVEGNTIFADFNYSDDKLELYGKDGRFIRELQVPPLRAAITLENMKIKNLTINVF